ncbi:MAG TPA: DUF6152 family protein [Hyphomonadaceae bacterium]|nr:DUF6152 family protein [Hyphomonadaceae bacterium]HPN04753.1 DUF6152 family protein [Hyphomonadaceae bacterium]
MRIIATALAAAALSSAALAGAAWAHHGWEAYDASKQQKVSGTISELKWAQPHAILWVNSGDKKLEIWLSPLQRMVDRGLKKEALAAGKSVTVEAQPHTKNVNEWKAQSITVDGKTFDLMR